MDRAYFLESLVMIRKDIKADDLYGAQMAIGYLLKNFLSEGKLLSVNNPYESDYDNAKKVFNELHQLFENFQVEYPRLFPRINLKTDLQQFINMVSEDGYVEFDFIYDYSYEDKLYNNINLNELDDTEDDNLKYNEEEELDMMFPNRDDDESWDE